MHQPVFGSLSTGSHIMWDFSFPVFLSEKTRWSFESILYTVSLRTFSKAWPYFLQKLCYSTSTFLHVHQKHRFFFFKFWMQRIADFSAKAPAHFLPACAVLSWPTPPHGGHAGLLPAFTRALPLKHVLLFRPKPKRRSRSVATAVALSRAFAGVWALNFEKIKWPQRIQRETARERKKRKIKQGIGLQGGERAGESRAEPWNAFAVTSLPFP